MADINASAPVTVSTAEMVFDKWFMTQMTGKFDATHGTMSVRLRRANKAENGAWTLMDRGDNSDVSFSVDVFTEMISTPEIATAMEAVVTAVTAYAQKKGLL